MFLVTYKMKNRFISADPVSILAKNIRLKHRRPKRQLRNPGSEASEMKKQSIFCFKFLS
jgi:hypothetical protein